MSSLKTKRIFHPSIDESSKRLVSDFVGNTPFVQLSDKIYAKLESVNPGGSIKDRPVKWIIDDAEKNNLLKPNDTIIIPRTNFNYFLSHVGTINTLLGLLNLYITFTRNFAD